MPTTNSKYQQTILYLCSQLGGRIEGKKKLAKLLYFADFDCFEKTGTSITGDIYKALPMGPFPTHLDQVTGEMLRLGMLRITKVQQWDGYIPTDVYEAERSPDANSLNEQEKMMLERIVKKYGGLSGKQLEELSHGEAPYVASGLNEVIPYELAYYRGTEFEAV